MERRPSIACLCYMGSVKNSFPHGCLTLCFMFFGSNPWSHDFLDSSERRQAGRLEAKPPKDI